MTFKHNDLNNSQTLRSLVRVAAEKGWISEETISKQASTNVSKLDTKPANNMLENIVKLCSGLRDAGFDTQADELESNYFTFKQAQALYDVSGEKGEDLVQSAHPQGSHKLVGVDGDEATVEDILDKHMKMLDVVNKKPSGKLSNAFEVLSAVKNVLGQTQPSKEQLQEDISNALNMVARDLEKIGQAVNGELTFSIAGHQDVINKLMSDPTIDNLKEVRSRLSQLSAKLDPTSWLHYVTFGATGLSEDSWRGIQGLLKDADEQVKNAISWRTQLKEIESQDAVSNVSPNQNVGNAMISVPETQISADPVIGQGSQLINTLTAYRSIGVIAKNQAAMTWIPKQIGEIKDVMKRYQDAEKTGKIAVVKSSLENEMNVKEKEVKDFYTKLVGNNVAV